jgi:type I restriction enzyme M protein
VQLIDAMSWFKPLRKNLGKKNCELSEDDIRLICETFLAFQETGQSKIFPNEAFGYWKVTVERPLRLHSQLTHQAIESLRFASGDEAIRSSLFEEFGDALFEDFDRVEKALENQLAEWSTGDEEEGEDEENGAPRKALSDKRKKKLLDAKTWERDGRLVETATLLRQELGGELFTDHNVFRDAVSAVLKDLGRKVAAADLKLILKAAGWRDESAPPVIAKVYKPGKVKPDPLYGLYPVTLDGKASVVEYEPDSDLRDTEQIPLLEEGGIEAFIRREVLPYTPDAWVKEEATKIGYEISFTRHFYKPQPLRTLEEIRADILAVQKEAEGVLDELLKGGPNP